MKRFLFVGFMLLSFFSWNCNADITNVSYSQLEDGLGYSRHELTDACNKIGLLGRLLKSMDITSGEETGVYTGLQPSMEKATIEEFQVEYMRRSIFELKESIDKQVSELLKKAAEGELREDATFGAVGLIYQIEEGKPMPDGTLTDLYMDSSKYSQYQIMYMLMEYEKMRNTLIAMERLIDLKTSSCELNLSLQFEGYGLIRDLTDIYDYINGYDLLMQGVQIVSLVDKRAAKLSPFTDAWDLLKRTCKSGFMGFVESITITTATISATAVNPLFAAAVSFSMDWIIGELKKPRPVNEMAYEGIGCAGQGTRMILDEDRCRYHPYIGHMLEDYYLPIYEDDEEEIDNAFPGFIESGFEWNCEYSFNPKKPAERVLYGSVKGKEETTAFEPNEPQVIVEDMEITPIQICNNNSVCESSENPFECPTDCKVMEDGVCQPHENIFLTMDCWTLDEPGSSHENAISVKSSQWMSGAVTKGRNVFYRVDVPDEGEATWIEAKTKQYMGPNLEIGIWDQNRDPIKQEHQTSTVSISRSRGDFDPENQGHTYYVVVRSRDEDTIIYDLKVELGGEFGCGGKKGVPKGIGLGRTSCDAFRRSSSASDYYNSFNHYSFDLLAPAERLMIELEYPQSENIDMEPEKLWLPDGSTTLNTNNMDIIYLNDPPEGKYKLRLDTDKGWGPFNLTISTGPYKTNGQGCDFDEECEDFHCAQGLCCQREHCNLDGTCVSPYTRTGYTECVKGQWLINQPPGITPMEKVVVEEGEVLELEPQIYDREGDNLSLSFGGDMQNSTWQTRQGDAGVYHVTVTVSDGQYNQTETATILVRKPSTPVYLSDMNETSVAKRYPQDEASIVYGGLKKDQDYEGGTLVLNGITYDKGIFMHAEKGDIYVSYNLSKKYRRFKSDVGIDEGKDCGNGARVSVYLDGESVGSVYTDGNSPTQSFDVDVTGAETLELEIDAIYNWVSCDHVVFGNASLSLLSWENKPPEIEPIPDLYASEGDVVAVFPEATDPEGDQLTYSISGPMERYGVWATRIGDAGNYSINVTVSDGEYNTSTVFGIILAKVQVCLLGENRTPLKQSLALLEEKADLFAQSYLDMGELELAQKWIEVSEKTSGLLENFEEKSSKEIMAGIEEITQKIP